jgi:hypothetical protein
VESGASKKILTLIQPTTPPRLGIDGVAYTDTFEAPKSSRLSFGIMWTGKELWFPGEPHIVGQMHLQMIIL